MPRLHMQGFQFKQFFVEHEHCAMKVGTDGTLLGAWTSAPASLQRILDIGTGSGLIALMLAQRFSEAHISAIDISEEAVMQAQKNFNASPWSNRLTALACPLQQIFEHYQEASFQLIVSNPPYFENSLKNPEEARQTARHTDTLPFTTLLHTSALLLSEGGELALVLPADTESAILALADECSLLPIHITHVCTKPDKAPKRILIQLRKTTGKTLPPPTKDTLPLMGADGAPRSDEYQKLCRDFYLDAADIEALKAAKE